ncbi:MAG TPA: sterol desaturase family protein, partial [Bryobacteraceae bacterium]|nr:sterol desaturase family protein [Bryobacteraceae bacterium]
VPLAVALLGNGWGYFIHANLRWRFGWLENVIATPAFHHWHHHNARAGHRHGNYAPTWPWIDRIFGTWHLDRAKFPEVYGVDEAVGESLAEQLVRPFWPRGGELG